MRIQSFVSAAFISDKNKVLLLHRSAGFKVWEFPGGGIEFGESPEEAAVREATEETGLVVKSLGLAMIGSHVIKEHQYIFFLYKCKYQSGEAKAKDEDHDNYGWFTLEQMERLPNLALSIKVILPKIKELLETE
jgi:8-oxo-dGTP diphosphatase